MVLKVITMEGKTIPIHSPSDFEQILQVHYLPVLQFEDEKVRKKVEKKCKIALAKKWITPRQKWLGCYYANEIRGTLSLYRDIDLKIAWMDDAIGYGVWTNHNIAAKAFVGEYTGLFRKRAFLGRWKNLYCFDYPIGSMRSTSFVIDCQDGGNHTRFINHSFTPNLDLVSVYCDGIIHVILFANREILAGEQLTYDYGNEYWKKRDKPVEIPSKAGVFP